MHAEEELYHFLFGKIFLFELDFCQDESAGIDMEVSDATGELPPDLDQSRFIRGDVLVLRRDAEFDSSTRGYKIRLRSVITVEDEIAGGHFGSCVKQRLSGATDSILDRLRKRLFVASTKDGKKSGTNLNFGSHCFRSCCKCSPSGDEGERAASAARAASTSSISLASSSMVISAAAEAAAEFSSGLPSNWLSSSG